MIDIAGRATQAAVGYVIDMVKEWNSYISQWTIRRWKYWNYVKEVNNVHTN
jgi:hypothetical protein